MVDQVKYELLSDVRRPRWKSQLGNACILLFLLIPAIFFAVRQFRNGIVIFGSIEGPALVWEVDNSGHREDAKIAAWVRRARMYAESTKENENADRNTSIHAPSYNGDNSARQILACYYTLPEPLNTSRELSPSQLDSDLCTHIILGFASVVNNSIFLPLNPMIYREVVALKGRQPELKIMISAGGGNELHVEFSEMVRNHANRKQFINSVLNVTKTYGFDGLDLDWEFPAWLGADDAERIHFCQLLEELRKAFDRSGDKLLLSVAVAAPQAIVDQSYDVPEMAKYVDFVNLMSYDYHFYVWYYPVTGLNSPLYPRDRETGYLSTLNVNFSAEYWVFKGMPRKKLIIGIPTYGHSYRLDNENNFGLSAPANGFGKLGTMGFVSFSQVCQFLRDGGGRDVFEEESKVPYAFGGREWTSYDDHRSVHIKGEWIVKNGFGGAMIFSLNDDDWNYTCGYNHTFPLTRILANMIVRNRQ